MGRYSIKVGRNDESGNLMVLQVEAKNAIVALGKAHRYMSKWVRRKRLTRISKVIR